MTNSTTPSNAFPERLRAARELRDLNQGQLADLANLQPSAVSHFETGSRKPSFDNLRRIADALDVTTDYLIGRVSGPTGLAGAERIHRHLGELTASDRQAAEEMIRVLAQRSRDRKQRQEKR